MARLVFPPLATLAMVACSLVACVDEAPPARSARPEPLPEIAQTPPAPGMVWVPGCWHWDGEGYVWLPGHWESPPPSG